MPRHQTVQTETLKAKLSYLAKLLLLAVRLEQWLKAASIQEQIIKTEEKLNVRGDSNETNRPS